MVDGARGTARRVVSGVVRKARVLGSASHPSSGSHGRISRAADHRSARQDADRLWGVGDGAASVELLRVALLELGNDPITWYVYGARLMQLHRSDSAFEAIKWATDLDPGNLAALELLIELARVAPHGEGAVTNALANLQEVLPERVRIHRDALAFLVPAQQEEAISVIAAGSDPVAAAAAKAQDLPREQWASHLSLLGPRDAREAELRILLARGSSSRADHLMQQMEPAELPVLALRLAIRRDLRRGRNKMAHQLLKHYLRVKPSDVWAKEKFEESKSKNLSNYQLTTVGFPFGKAAKQPAYEARLGRSLYLLHNSLPYHSAGYATRTHGLLSALVDAGWDVSGVTRLGYPYDMPGHESDGPLADSDLVDQVRYSRLSTEPGLEMKNPIQGYVRRYSRALAAMAREERPFVLHAASNHWNGLTAVQTSRRLGIPSIYEVRGLWEVTRGSRDPEWAQGGMYRFMARMEADAAKAATRVIAITGALRDELVERGVDREKIVLVPNGVDVDRFVPRARNEELAARLGLSHKTVIGYVGSILDYEGLGLLIEAAAILRRERKDFAVLIVGDGAERVAFEERVADEGLGDAVIFTGRVPHSEVEDYYSIIDICPFPRLPLPVCEMVSPLKPFEALAMGKAVVASDVAALAEIITDNSNGLLHRKGDVGSLVSQLRRLLDDPELVARLSADGLEWVRANRRWDTLAGRITDLYEELGGRRRETGE